MGMLAPKKCRGLEDGWEGKVKLGEVGGSAQGINRPSALRSPSEKSCPLPDPGREGKEAGDKHAPLCLSSAAGLPPDTLPKSQGCRALG